MDRNTVVILYLSILLSVTQFYWLKAERKASYLQGQQDAYDSMSLAAPDAESH